VTDDDKGAYRRSDIQGDVLPGFRGRDDVTFHQQFLLARVVGGAGEARAGLRRLLDEGLVSSGARVMEGPRDTAFVNVAFTATGLERLGRRSDDPVLIAGPAERRVVGDPSGWSFGSPGSDTAMVINVGAPDGDVVAATAGRVLDLLGPAYAIDRRIDGAKLDGGTEHFGFRDGLAQPFVADDRPAPRTTSPDGNPATTALWPNWEALRLRHLADVAGADEAAEAKLAAQQEELNEVVMRSPGVPIRPLEQFVVSDGDAFTHNGSYMVLLQLEQRPVEFWSMCRDLAGRMQAASGRAGGEEEAAAHLLGRRLDGTPLEPHPEGEIEDFGYYDDPSGRTCPTGAHVRLTNPRDYQSAGAMILRRGIPYGPPATDRTTRDGQERGLVFVCYQADITEQYEQIQGSFADALYDRGKPIEAGHPGGAFPDALISGEGRAGSTVEIPHPDGRGSVGMRLCNTWVIPRGGLYLFVPSMPALELLSTSDG
jgi:Dyp-type peroxidase family